VGPRPASVTCRRRILSRFSLGFGADLRKRSYQRRPIHICMSGTVVGVGILLIAVGIMMLLAGVGGKGRVESDIMDASGPVGLIVLVVGAIVVIFGG